MKPAAKLTKSSPRKASSFYCYLFRLQHSTALCYLVAGNST
jgi:hypothetical protein